MASGHPELIEVIRGEIAERGTISFARFMYLALYHPNYGYYASGHATIGRTGDFFTNVSVGSSFGCLLAAQFAEVWQQLGSPSVFTVVEQGAHDGIFAADALAALFRFRPRCFDAARYTIIEPFSLWQHRQRKTLATFGDKVRWTQAVDELESFIGIHFSNELFDALPVHLITSGTDTTGNRWHERVVSADGNEFQFMAARICDPTLQSRTTMLPALPEGFQTEINLEAPALAREIAKKISQGVILTIDYGFPRPEFYSPDRTGGTLQVRSRHRKLSSPFKEIGRADISAHVEWTSIAEAGESAGATVLGFADQHHFFSGILSDTGADIVAHLNKHALQTLLHPELLGRSFRVLTLAKNFHGSLSGFRFARDPRTELGMAS